jgi:hypothetical protein
MDLLASDLIESVNNILKPIAEAALPLAAATARRVGSIAGKTAKSYADGAEKGAVAHAKKIGQSHGAAIVKWLNRLVVGGAAGGHLWFIRRLVQFDRAIPRSVPVARAFVAILRADPGALSRFGALSGGCEAKEIGRTGSD